MSCWGAGFDSIPATGDLAADHTYYDQMFTTEVYYLPLQNAGVFIFITTASANLTVDFTQRANFITSLTSQRVLQRSTDPLADVCSPLCTDETTLALEEDSGRLLGCSELDPEEDPDVVLACWTPCFAPTEECFSLCAERFDYILQLCYNDCSQQQNTVDCIAVCFNSSFLDFKHGLSTDENNSTSDTNPNINELSEVTMSPVKSLLNTTDPDVNNFGTPSTDTGNRFDYDGAMHDTKSQINSSAEFDKSFLNNDTSMDMLDFNNAMKVDSLLSKLFPEIFNAELRLLKKKFRSRNH